MEQSDFELLRRIVFETATILQNGAPATADQWFDIADELERARVLVATEGKRLEDRQLERAHYACTAALAGRTVLGDASTPAVVYDRFETLRRQLYRVLEARAAERAEAAPDVPVPPVHVDKPNLGPMARLQPIVTPRPPAGAYGRPEIRF